jgi:plasmid stabilization system protein ParE
VVQEIVWTPRALGDLRKIHDYIAVDSIRYAQVQIDTIQAAVLTLSDFPFIGRRVPEFPNLPYREIIAGNFRIMYRFEEQRHRVLIMTVVHGRQMLKEPPL